jgi:cytochrome c biogenesis protein CcdA
MSDNGTLRFAVIAAAGWVAVLITAEAVSKLTGSYRSAILTTAGGALAVLLGARLISRAGFRLPPAEASAQLAAAERTIRYLRDQASVVARRAS